MALDRLFFGSPRLLISFALLLAACVDVSLGRCARQCAKAETSFEVVIFFVSVCSVCYVIMWWLIADETMFGFGSAYLFFPFIISYHFSSPCFFLSRVSTLPMILYFIFCSLYQRLLAVRSSTLNFVVSAIVFVCVSFLYASPFSRDAMIFLTARANPCACSFTLKLPPEILM